MLSGWGRDADWLGVGFGFDWRQNVEWLGRNVDLIGGGMLSGWGAGMWI